LLDWPTTTRPRRARSTPNAEEDPSPEFLAHLERETRFALRRVPRASVLPWRGALRTAALVAASVLAGASAVAAVGHFQEARERELALQRNHIRMELVERKLELAQQHVVRADHMVAAAVASQTFAAEAAARRQELARQQRHLQLEREALQAGGAALPADGDVDVTAPLVRQRDFVSEHLRVDGEAADTRVERLRAAHERAELQHSSGLVPQSVVRAAHVDLAAAERAARLVADRLALRADFVLGRTTAQETLHRDLVLRTEARRGDLADRLAALTAELRLAQSLSDVGRMLSPHTERGAVLDAEAELALVDLELEALGVVTTPADTTHTPQGSAGTEGPPK
jgi:hypothetical protein